MAHKLLEGRDLTENALREAILDLLARSPGSYLGKMGRDLGVPTSTLKYHLNILRSFDMVTTVKKGRCRHYFPKRRRFTDAEKRMFAALEHAPTRRMVELVRQHPGVSQAGLVSMTGLSQSTVAWHMGKLEEMLLVVSERRGVKEYRLAPDFHQVLDAFQRGDDDARPTDDPGPADGPVAADPWRAADEPVPLPAVAGEDGAGVGSLPGVAWQ
ncbi:MAG TPA: winged helix-turn-helix transcriptional regulator [Candidatus Thermoplasmatota archaeon]|nr:winged helix-turn-helix transcriptional regulator [Candidatus Thermoplasmatota archaeon]